MEIAELDVAAVERHADELAQLLLDAHASNIALGLAAPLTPERAADEWRRCAAALSPGARVLLGALDQDIVVGAVHLARAHAENGGRPGGAQGARPPPGPGRGGGGRGALPAGGGEAPRGR